MVVVVVRHKALATLTFEADQSMVDLFRQLALQTLDVSGSSGVYLNTHAYGTSRKMRVERLNAR